MLRLELLLVNDREIGGYARAFSGQRLSKHVPAATDTHATDGVFFVVRAEMLQARDKVRAWTVNVREDLSRRQRDDHCCSRHQETSSNRLRTIDCVL
jgi:hypothetical protein